MSMFLDLGIRVQNAERNAIKNQPARRFQMAKKDPVSNMPITVKELRELLVGCDDDARITAFVIDFSKSETTGWVAAKRTTTITRKKGIEMIVDTRGID